MNLQYFHIFYIYPQFILFLHIRSEPPGGLAEEYLSGWRSASQHKKTVCMVTILIQQLNKPNKFCLHT